VSAADVQQINAILLISFELRLILATYRENMVFVQNQTTVRENDSTTNDNQNETAPKDFVAWLAAFVVVGILIIVLNLATLLTFFVNKHLRRRSVYCLINLAVADMMYGGTGTAYSLCIFVEGYLKLELDFRVRLVVFVLSTFAFVAALLSLALISLERAYATVFPFRHRTTLVRKYLMVFAILWTLALIVSLFFNLTPRSLFQAVFICYWVILTVSLVAMIASYAIIVIKVKLQDKQHHRHQTQSAIQKAQKRERDLAMTLFIVTIISLLTWLPYLTVRVLYLMKYDSFDLSSSLPSLVSVVFLIQWLNSLINPVIYVYRMKDFRKAFCLLFFRCSRDWNHVHPIGNHGDLKLQGVRSCVR
jgi:hypothetical protein